jgi:alanine-synthesizing transaminase
MRRDIVHPGAGHLKYEIRQIVGFARSLSRWNVDIAWENIGDPVKKGESLPGWMKEIVRDAVTDDATYAYTDTEGSRETREFLAARANDRGGCRIGPDDIMFFNGLGDAVAKVFGFLKREARVLGPSPAYSTLSSAEAAHSGYEHLTYRLDPEHGWLPDMADVEMKVRYNDSVAGILLINPNNPTGAVYPECIIREFVRIAKTYRLFLVCDETYASIVYGGANTVALSGAIGEVPGLSLRSVSKEFPWPGARCGWIEAYNKDKDPVFAAYVRSLLDAKRLEVCSTSLPQIVIPRIMGDGRYPAHLARRAAMFGSRADEAAAAFEGIPGVKLVKPEGAFYASAVFSGGLPAEGRLPVSDPSLAAYIEEQVAGLAPDKRFAYWLLASTGICVVPLTGFVSDLPGFRFTLLETDDERRRWIFGSLAEACRTYLASV